MSRMQSLMLKFGEAGMEGDIVKANDSWAPCLIAKARLLEIMVCAFWILCGSPFGHLKSSSSSSVAYQGRLQNSCNSRPVRRRTESFSKVTPTAYSVVGSGHHHALSFPFAPRVPKVSQSFSSKSSRRLA